MSNAVCLLFICVFCVLFVCICSWGGTGLALTATYVTTFPVVLNVSICPTSPTNGEETLNIPLSQVEGNIQWSQNFSTGYTSRTGGIVSLCPLLFYVPAFLEVAVRETFPRFRNL